MWLCFYSDTQFGQHLTPAYQSLGNCLKKNFPGDKAKGVLVSRIPKLYLKSCNSFLKTEIFLLLCRGWVMAPYPCSTSGSPERRWSSVCETTFLWEAFRKPAVNIQDSSLATREQTGPILPVPERYLKLHNLKPLLSFVVWQVTQINFPSLAYWYKTSTQSTIHLLQWKTAQIRRN